MKVKTRARAGVAVAVVLLGMRAVPALGEWGSEPVRARAEVAAEAGLSASIGQPDPLLPGQFQTITIRLGNVGPAPARLISVGVTVTAAPDRPDAGCDPADVVVRIDRSALDEAARQDVAAGQAISVPARIGLARTAPAGCQSAVLELQGRVTSDVPEQWAPEGKPQALAIGSVEAPAGVARHDLGPGVRLSWRAASSSGFEVQRAGADGPWADLDPARIQCSAGDCQFVDADGGPGDRYRVRSVAGPNWRSPFSYLDADGVAPGPSPQPTNGPADPAVSDDPAPYPSPMPTEPTP